MLRPAIAALFAIALSAPALASSAEAWDEHEKAVNDACIAASGLKDARALSQLVMFGDDVGYDALLVTGEYPQDHMRGKTAMSICLYRKADGTAVASEISDK